MAQISRQTLYINKDTPRKKPQYGTMFSNLIDSIEENFFSELDKVLQPLNGKTVADFNESFRIQKLILKVINQAHINVQRSYDRAVCPQIFDDLIKKISIRLQDAKIEIEHFDKALKAFKPCVIQQHSEPTRVSYKSGSGC